MASIAQPAACLHTDSRHAVWANAIVGISFHIAIAASHIEFERYIFHSATLVAVCCVSDFILVNSSGGCNHVDAFAHLFISFLGFSAGTLISLIVYRGFFHRCNRFPGPPIAKFSRFYAAYLNAGDAQFYKELKSLHMRYGDFVRMGKFCSDWSKIFAQVHRAT